MLVLLFACGPSEPPPTLVVPDIPTVVFEPVDTPPPWLRTGESGHLALIRSAATPTQLQELRIAAVFGSDLVDVPFPATCGLDDQLCVDHDDPLDEDRFEPIATGADRYSWLGDHLQVGPTQVPFRVRGSDGAAGYHGTLDNSTPLIDRLPVHFEGGEWGTGDLEVPLPRLFAGLEPSTEAEVAVSDTGLQVFRWAPRGGTVYLTLTGETWSSTRRIDDDGSVWVDTREFRLGEPVEVKLTRVTEEGEVVIGGNQVAIRGVAEQSWCLTDGCENEPFEIYPQPFDFQFCWSTSNCQTSSWRVEEDGTWTTGPFAGTWSYDCCGGGIEFLFTSGTRYSATRDEEGCYHGEMESWSGSRGTWTTCP